MAEQKSGNKQRGSTFWGFMGGLVVGVAVAAAVALYITKVPTPFTNRNQQRTADQDVVEQKRNSTWDPNAALYGRNPAPRAASAPAATAPAPATPAPAEPRAQATATARTTPPPTVDEAPVAEQPAQRPARATANATATANAAAAPAATARATSTDPLGELVNRTARTAPAPVQTAAATTPAAATADPYNYVLQVGAYNSMADAESQRARLSMQGIDARISEREVNGRNVFRVRVGPFDTRDAAERTKERLDAAGSVATLLRVQR